jgi:hypothetical protein
MAADGIANTEIAECLEVSRSTVLGWRKGFAEHGVDWVGKVRPGRGPKPTISQDRIEKMVHDTLHTSPTDGSTHWSVRSMARHSGLSKSTVQKVWHARKIGRTWSRPSSCRTTSASKEKLTDVVDLYLNAPEDSVVPCVDEKSQIQALNRTQPSLPRKPGRAGTVTHDYKRNGTTTLFAALNVVTGMLLFSCMPRHRNGEFRKFLRPGPGRKKRASLGGHAARAGAGFFGVAGEALPADRSVPPTSGASSACQTHAPSVRKW